MPRQETMETFGILQSRSVTNQDSDVQSRAEELEQGATVPTETQNTTFMTNGQENVLGERCLKLKWQFCRKCNVL